jgi:hypothetical protein
MPPTKMASIAMATKRKAVPSKPAYVPSSSGLMDFEPVSIEEARAALDEVDQAIAALVSPEYWQKVRRAAKPSDRALTGRSMQWLARLPEEVRPSVTLERYPRVINALADVWSDVDARDQAFDNLLNDKRKGRRGFPIDVERELSTLCLYASALPR